jgi:hypothetical protein
MSEDPGAARKKWQEECGGQVEQDAVEATHPGVLAGLVRRALEAFLDEGLAERVRVAREEAESVLAHERQEIIARHPEIAALQEGFALLRQEQERIRDVLVAEMVQATVDLPTLPVAEEPEGLDSEPLYDSERDYLEQCASYQQWKTKGA